MNANIQTNERFRVEAMPVGAQIEGLDLSIPIDELTRAALYSAWLEHGILLFRGTATTAAEHMALSLCFGELEKHPMPEIWADGEPYLISLGGDKPGAAYVYDGGDLRVGRLPWHRDTAYTVEICKGAILRLVEIPPEGGETLFADSQMAYERLPQKLKDRIEGLEVKATLRIGPLQQSRPGATWQTVRRPLPEEYSMEVADIGMETIPRYPSVIQPVVIKHPETGKRCLFLSPTYIDEIVGMSRLETDALVSELVGHLTDPKNVYVHNWQVNDMMLWDNRRFLHAAYGCHPRHRRRGLRTTLAGSLKSGRYAEAQAATFVPAIKIND